MNPFIPSSTQKQKPKVTVNDSIVESIRNVGTGVTSTVTHDVAGKVATDALAALLGQLPKKSGELTENQAVAFGPEPRLRTHAEQRPAAPVWRTEVPRQRLIDAEMTRVREQLTAVRQELKALSESIKNFHQDIQKAINEVPVNPGIYHVNFLERLRSILKILREQIDDSRTWLTLSTNRKQKKQYWGMYKKHGTQFGLSSERTIATQAG